MIAFDVPTAYPTHPLSFQWPGVSAFVATPVPMVKNVGFELFTWILQT